MTFANALIYSLLGMAVVFFALVLLMGMIKVLVLLTTKKENPKYAEPPALAPGAAGDVKLFDTDPREAAMIMAIVAEQLQTPINELRFISIKEIKE